MKNFDWGNFWMTLFALVFAIGFYAMIVFSIIGAGKPQN